MDYEPPEGRKTFEDMTYENPNHNAWPLINAIREGAEKIMGVARSFGFGLDENQNDPYEHGKGAFPSLLDRMHLSAVVAKCAAFCAHAEAHVKNYFHPDKIQIEAENCWPFKANDEVQRHERNLGLRSPEVSHKVELEHEPEDHGGELEKTDERENHERDD